MNKKVIALIIVVVVVALVALAVIYAPSITEMMQGIHSIPQH